MKTITILILFISVKVLGFDYQIDTVNFHSDILNENREIYYYQPNDLKPADSVLFLYLLDGEYSGYRYKEIQNEYPNKQIIGIGIVNSNRNRDMLAAKQADNFLSFITKELIPKVENDFKVKERIIFGHSFAGGFVINTMIQSPGLFDKYISSSPTPIMDFVNPDIYKQLDKQLNTNIYFYYSCGSKDMKQVRKWTMRLEEGLTDIEFEKIYWKNDIYKDKKHSNCDLISLINGLKY